MTGDRTTVVFLCSGNICRSPYAEAAARATLDPSRFDVASAGTIATPDLSATDTMQEVAAERGLDVSGHRARRLHDIDQPDWIIGMEQHHLVSARAAFPDLPASRIRLLDHPRAVPDPYGQGRAVYEAAATQIDESMSALADILDG